VTSYTPSSPCELLQSLDISFGLMYRPCTIRNSIILSVYDVCPKDVCFTQGCQPTLEKFAKWNVITPLLVILAAYSIGFIFGLIFIFQLTHNFRKIVGLESRRTLQRKSSKERRNIHKAPAWVSMEEEKFPQILWGYLSRCLYSDYVKIKQGNGQFFNLPKNMNNLFVDHQKSFSLVAKRNTSANSRASREASSSSKHDSHRGT